MVGNIAISLSGHDKGKAYIIIEENEKYVFLCDGKTKKTGSPKKKSKKHVQINKSFDAKDLGKGMRDRGKIYDHEVIELLKLWKKSISEV